MNEIERIFTSTTDERVSNHTLLQTALSIKNTTVLIIKHMNNLRSMGMQEVIKMTNEIVNSIASSTSIESLNLGHIHFMSLCISGTFSDHPDMEDIVVDSLVKVEKVLNRKTEAIDIVKNLVLPRRQKLHGIRSTNALQKVLDDNR